MTTEATTNIESEVNNGATTNEENLSFESNQISSDEQLSQIIDSINLAATSDETNIDESQSKSSTTRPTGQTAIGAKLVKKLETLGRLSLQSSSSPPTFSIRFQLLIPRKINQPMRKLQLQIRHRHRAIMNQNPVEM